MPQWRARSEGRNRQLDALRGIAMLAVVLNHSVLASGASVIDSLGDSYWNLVTLGLGHVGVWVSASMYESIPLNIAYVFHVALFAFVGGLLVNLSVPLRTFILRRVQRLLVPYVAWLAVSLALVPPTGIDAWLRGVSRALINPHSAGSLWFLPVYFFCVVLSRLMVSAGLTPRMLMWSSLVVVAMSWFPTAPVLRYFGDVLWLFPFYVAGVFARSAGLDLGRRRPFMTVALGTLLLMCGLAVTWPPILGQIAPWMSFASPLVLKATFSVGRYMAAAGAILCLLALTRTATSWLSWAEVVGRRSIGVYAAHGLLLGPLILLDLRWPVIFILSVMGGLGITWVIERSPVAGQLFLGIPSCESRLQKAA